MKSGISIFISLSIFYFANGALLGAKECTYGPAYWCSSIETAKECNAMSHCIETVWEKKTLPEDNDNICMLCKDMVKQARDQLLSNETQDEIRQVFEGSCELIPMLLIRDECVKVSDDFIPQLIDSLASQMNPQMVCATAGLCNSAKVDHLLDEYYKTHENKELVVATTNKGPRDCKDCNAFFSDVVNEVRSVPRSQVLNKILSICGRLGSFSDGCMSLVQSNFDFIYDFLKTGLKPNEICDVIGMCERLHGKELISAPRTEEEPCDFCVAIVKSWRNNFLSNTTKDDFKMILDGMCEQTGKFKSECKALVDEYFEMIYYIIASQIQPKEICEAIGICGDNSIFNVDVPVWTMLGIHPENQLPDVPYHFAGDDEAASYKNDVHLPDVSFSKGEVNVINLGESGVVKKGLKLKKGDKCIMCEFVLHFLQNELSKKATREEIKAELDQFCTYFPHHLSEECQDYVDAYGDQIIQLIVLEIDPSQVCPMLHLCPSISLKNFPSVSAKDNTQCVLCEYVMTELDQIIGDKSNEAQVKKAVEKVCTLLPKSIRSECKSFIDMYIDQIVDLLVNDYTPRQICAQLGLCDKDVKKEAKKSDDCVLCEFVFEFLKTELNENSTREEIVATLDQVCTLFPLHFAEECQDYIDAYGNDIIELIVSEIDYSQICAMLHWCPSIKGGVTTCGLCEIVVTELDQIISDKSNEDQIKKAVDNVCTLLGVANYADCKHFIDKYVDQIVDLLVNDFTPKQICALLVLCDKNNEISINPKKSQLPLSRIFLSNSLQVNLPQKSKFLPSQSPTCIICEFIISKLDSILVQKSTEDEIRNAVDQVCLLLPGSLTNDCLGFMEEYANALIELLAQQLSPGTICREIKLCKKESSLQNLPTAILAMPMSSECETCEAIVKLVDEKVQAGASVQEIETAILESYCNALQPIAKSQKQCANLVDSYGTLVIALLEELKNEKKVCQAIDFCPRMKNSKPLLGAKKCTWGPGYWCKSKIHAKSCDAIPYCTEKVWLGKVPKA